MSLNYASLLEKAQAVHDLSKAQAPLSWDREVIMPKVDMAVNPP